MHYSLFFRTDAYILVIVLFVACILAVSGGHWLRHRFLTPEEPESRGGVNSLMGALFGLWGFLLAFTFGNSASRFENVRSVTVEETNAIRSSILRTHFFPDSVGEPIRKELGNYITARLTYYNNAWDTAAFRQSWLELQQAKDNLVENTIRHSDQPNLAFASNSMFASLTALFDVGSRRDALLMGGVPEAVQVLLFALAITISFIGGFTTPVIQLKEWFIICGFILLACCIIYITLDMARPMRGFIRPENGEQRMEELYRLLQH